MKATYSVVTKFNYIKQDKIFPPLLLLYFAMSQPLIFFFVYSSSTFVRGQLYVSVL